MRSHSAYSEPITVTPSAANCSLCAATKDGEGRIICTDCSPYAPALYEADAHYIVPRITEPGYLEVIYEICRKESITGVLSLIDPELSFVAAHKDLRYSTIQEAHQNLSPATFFQILSV